MRSTILKEIAILTREKLTRKVVIRLRINTSLSIYTKTEENTVNNWPRTHMGINKNMNFVQMNFLDVMGAVFKIHKYLPSVTSAG
jgi:hypothetical protein